MQRIAVPLVQASELRESPLNGSFGSLPKTCYPTDRFVVLESRITRALVPSHRIVLPLDAAKSFTRVGAYSYNITEVGCQRQKNYRKLVVVYSLLRARIQHMQQQQ